ncbi:MAG: ABC transporter ATP-binding protein [Candidatus Omnitrophica bacterium]|nr:ABC transporter ATP-binding protein [Candidatus Omnitrophota bacterium]
MIKAKGVHKIYTNGAEKLPVLKGIDLKIEKGEFVSVLGPSGAGKSTLLHILGALDEPTQGVVYLDGSDVYGLTDSKRAQARNRLIGFVFQFYHLLPEFTALENVMLPGLISSQSAAGGPRSRAKELLGLVGLGARLNHKPGQLSGGEQQRAAIARALVNKPAVLLCDEPTGNLDSESGKGIIDLLERVNKEEKATLVVVTHEAQIAKRADRILKIKDGRLE